MYSAYVMSENSIISRNRSLEKENKIEKNNEKTRYESTANEIDFVEFSVRLRAKKRTHSLSDEKQR